MTEEVISFIEKAAAKVESRYLNLTTAASGESGVVRERVFCYELYHQLRLLLGDNHQLTLNGEIDKRGHIDFKPNDRKNPDFIFHIQGQHEGNTLIVEVKGKLDKSGIKKDFETLITFVSKYKYEAGVFLLYNHTIKELIKILNQEFPDFEKVDCADRIFIIVLPTAGQVKQAQKLSSLK